jgi:diguanylate cyclase (GGDEF)-like protein/PAS domain S-box-containing protein
MVVPEAGAARYRRVMAGYGVWMALLLAAYYLLPGLRVEAWGLLGLSGVAAIVAGVTLNRPARKAPWLLLAAANACFIAGQVSFLVAERFREVLPFPSFADGLYLAEYPFYAAAALVFIRFRSPERDRRSLLDALTLTAGLALLSWLYLVLPYARDPSLSWLQKSVTIAYPLGDVLVLAIVARLLAPETMRNRAVQLLTVGTVGLLAADVLYGLIQLHGTFRNGTPVDLGWAALYAAWGAAALHPSMTQLTEPVAVQRAEASPARVAVLMLGALIAPGVLLVGSLRDHYSDGTVIAVFSAVLYLLVLTRLSDTAASHRRTLRRERAVRRAGASLASAGTVEDAARAAEGAAAALLGPRAPGSALLAVRAGDRLLAVGAIGTLPRQQEPDLGAEWLPRLGGPRPAFVPVADLGGPVAALHPDCEGALLCPLVLSDRPSGDPLIGVLAVFGRRAALAGLSGTLEVLAGQVALAVERIILSREVTKKRSEEYFRTLVQDASEVILIVGEGDVIRYATPSAAGIFCGARIQGSALPDLAGPASRAGVSRALARMRDRARTGHHEELWHLSGRDGRPVQVKVRCSDLREDPTVAGLVLTLRDVTEERRLEEQLKHQAFHDPLTGLPNRLLFQDRAGRALEAARGGGYDAAVVFVDLDDFKMVNDTMGHAVGDALLAAVAGRLAGVVRESDTAARLGGDEFALLIEPIADPAEADALAARVVRAFSAPFSVLGRQVVTAATAGVATTRDSADADELLRHADLALYAAKSAGKRQWRRYQPVLAAGMIRRQEVQSALGEALASSAFTLAYQPIVALDSGEIAGFEALVRWPHPDWGLMMPGEFIALAEESGQIVPLGAWVLRQAAQDMARWRAEGHSGLYVNVNVSARQFLVPDFAGSVADALASSGLDACALVLELTESALLDHDDRVNSALKEVKRAGVRLAIDDFGTGYSTLSYLQELPIDVLKIDKSFTNGVAASPRQRVLVEGIIAIASGLDLQVVAEGIETEEQRRALVAAGCGYGQGYLLAKPAGPDQAAELIRRRQPLVPGLTL